MPYYDYECKKCGIVEIEQKIKDKPLSNCPTCNLEGFKRLISKTSFALKGGGWYKDFYHKKPKNN